MEYEKKCYKTTYISLPCVKQPPPQEQSAATSSTIPNTQSTLISNAEYRMWLYEYKRRYTSKLIALQTVQLNSYRHNYIIMI